MLHSKSSGPELKPPRPCDIAAVMAVPYHAHEVSGVESFRGGKVCTVDLGAAERCGGEVGPGEIIGRGVACQSINSS